MCVICGDIARIELAKYFFFLFFLFFMSRKHGCNLSRSLYGMAVMIAALIILLNAKQGFKLPLYVLLLTAAWSSDACNR